LPLSVVKCFAIHYSGRHAPNPKFNYCINNAPIASVENCADLGVLRQADGLYKQYIGNAVAKASRRVGISLRAFTCRNADFICGGFLCHTCARN